MTLQQLEYIIAVDHYHHFVKAAEHCRVTQPTLSAMVQKLEDELGAKLFDRSRLPVATTPLGQKVVEQARRVVALAGNITKMVDEEKQSLKGQFNIGILPTIAPYLIPRFFPQLRMEHPELDLRVSELKTDEVKAALTDGSIDAGIVAALPQLSQYRSQVLYYDEFLAYVASGDPLSAKEVIRTDDLRSARLWLLDEGHCFRDQMVRFCQLKLARISQAVYRLGSMETFMRMVESGQGVTLIPQTAVQYLSQEQRQLVRPFAIPRPTRTIVLITTPNFVRHTVADAIAHAIRTSLPQSMLQLSPTQVAI